MLLVGNTWSVKKSAVDIPTGFSLCQAYHGFTPKKLGQKNRNWNW